MTSITIVVVLLVGLSLCYAAPSSPATTHGSTIFDNLKDGYDTIYKYKRSDDFTYQTVSDLQSIKCDAYLRKSPQEPNQFIMYLKNVEYRKDPPNCVDSKAMKLPVIVSVKDESYILMKLQLRQLKKTLKNHCYSNMTFWTDSFTTLQN